MYFFRNVEAQPVEMLPQEPHSLTRRTLAHGEVLMICEFTFAEGVQIPTHTHPHEQAGYVASGRMRMTIAGQEYDLGPGDSYYAPSNVPHSGLCLEPAVVVDTFSPPRQDYLPT